MGEVIHLHTRTEPWITKRQLSSCIGFGQRWIEVRMSRGMPHRTMGGKVHFQLSAVEEWLRARGEWRDDHQAS